MKRFCAVLLVVAITLSCVSAMAETIFSGTKKVYKSIPIYDIDDSIFYRDFLVDDLTYSYSISTVYGARFVSGTTILSTSVSNYLSSSTIIVQLNVRYSISRLPPYGTVQPNGSIWYPPAETINATTNVKNRL